jgi:hypothetical protein
MKTKQIATKTDHLSLPYNNGNPSASGLVVTQTPLFMTLSRTRQKTPKGYEIPVPTRKAVLRDLKRIAKAPKPKA